MSHVEQSSDNQLVTQHGLFSRFRNHLSNGLANNILLFASGLRPSQRHRCFLHSVGTVLTTFQASQHLRRMKDGNKCHSHIWSFRVLLMTRTTGVTPLLVMIAATHQCRLVLVFVWFELISVTCCFKSVALNHSALSRITSSTSLHCTRRHAMFSVASSRQPRSSLWVSSWKVPESFAPLFVVCLLSFLYRSQKSSSKAFLGDVPLSKVCPAKVCSRHHLFQHDFSWWKWRSNCCRSIHVRSYFITVVVSIKRRRSGSYAHYYPSHVTRPNIHLSDGFRANKIHVCTCLFAISLQPHMYMYSRFNDMHFSVYMTVYSVNLLMSLSFCVEEPKCFYVL